MYVITIKNPDQSLYWKEEFYDKATGDQWLNEEKTRAYWKKDFIVEILDESQKEMDRINAEKAALAANEVVRRSRIQRIKSLKDKPSKSAKDLEDLLNLLVDHVL